MLQTDNQPNLFQLNIIIAYMQMSVWRYDCILLYILYQYHYYPSGGGPGIWLYFFCVRRMQITKVVIPQTSRAITIPTRYSQGITMVISYLKYKTFPQLLLIYMYVCMRVWYQDISVLNICDISVLGTE